MNEIPKNMTELYKSLREDIEGYFYKKIKNANISDELRDKIDDLIWNYINNIQDEAYFLDSQIDDEIMNFSIPKHTQADDLRDMESFIYNCCL